MRPEPDLNLAERLFGQIREQSFDGVGITRDSYGQGEQKAHDLVRSAARGLGLEVVHDAALNLFVTLPGKNRDAPIALTGSHLDSVPRGGNFDGAAGVFAGLSVLAGWRRRGFVPPADCTVVAFRAEESAWFPISYPGSKAAFGQLPPEALGLPRSDTGRSLAEHLTACGGMPNRIACGEASLDPRRISRFIELHIEQGPVLADAGEPIGIVTGIRGSFRYREAVARGAYAHSGATPRSHRRDAVVAAVELTHALGADWRELEAQGRDLTVTVGRFNTDPLQADFSKVAGRVDFCIDVRSYEVATLAEMSDRVLAHSRRIHEETGVTFELGARTGSEPATMDAALRKRLAASAVRAGVPAREMPCGAGHDAAVCANLGIPTAMIFVRNVNGSHNPLEMMDLADFACGTRILADVLAESPG